MIAETLAGIALVKSAVDGIKSTINTANDIGDIAKYVDSLLEGEKQVQQQRAKKSGVGIGMCAWRCTFSFFFSSQSYCMHVNTNN